MAKILIVDDELDFIQMMEIRLEANGYEVIAAHNGEEGIEKVKSDTPDLIIMDVMMPVMNGLEACSLLKGDEKYKKIPIIICTGMTQKVDEKVSQNIQADGYVAKPFEHQELLDKIEELLNKPS